MASIIPIASQEKFDSISPVRSNGLAINLELQFRGGGGDASDEGDQLQLQNRRRSELSVVNGGDGGGRDSCADLSMAPSNNDEGGCSSDVGCGGSSVAAADEDDELPPETFKTLLCLALLLVVFVANLLSVATIQNRTPVTKQDANRSHPPLRDIAYDVASGASLLREHQFVLMASAELAVVVTSAYVLGAAIVFHPHRSIVLRRFCFLLALLFGVRLLTMNATMLPVSNATLYQCMPRESDVELGVIASRLLDLVAGLGLSALDGDAVRYCGNYVFSGHTVLLVLNCLWADEYGSGGVGGPPRRRLLNLSMKVVAAGSLLLLIATGFDYTISIITAYYATTRIFWIYHTMANNASLKRPDPANQVCKEWWYPVFRYLEGNVRGVVTTSPNSSKF